MPGPYKIAPLVAAGLAFLSTVSFAASPLAFAALTVVLVVVLAGIDGRATTAGALVTGWVIAAAGVLISLYLTTLEPPPGTYSMVGIAFVLVPQLVLALSIFTAIAFASARFVRWLKRSGVSGPPPSATLQR
jgi:hypothetical protein